MPRIGRHPAKTSQEIPIPKSQQITITTIVHIPELMGFWSQSQEVLKLFFSSLVNNTDQTFDLMVFDQGSCQQVKDYLLNLQRKGMIQYLIFSKHNLRKTKL